MSNKVSIGTYVCVLSMRDGVAADVAPDIRLPAVIYSAWEEPEPGSDVSPREIGQVYSVVLSPFARPEHVRAARMHMELYGGDAPDDMKDLAGTPFHLGDFYDSDLCLMSPDQDPDTVNPDDRLG